MEKKRKPFVLRFLLVILYIILALVTLVVAGGIFSALHRKNSLSLLPPDYSLHLHMDRAWDSLDPLIDLQAADVILSQPELSEARKGFIAWRASPLRQSKLLALAANRKVDAALYTQENTSDFVAVVDLSYLSLATRLLPLYSRLIHVENLSFVKSIEGYGPTNFITYKAGEDMTIFAKPVRNTVVVSNSRTLFTNALLESNDTQYTAQALRLLRTKSKNPIRVIANAGKLSGTFLKGQDENSITSKIIPLIKEDTLSLITFSITDSNVQVEANVPLDPPEGSSLSNLITTPAKLPVLPPRLSERVQYYTLINAGTLRELKDASFPLLPPEKKIDSLWNTGSAVCKTVFSTSLEDLLFSWTGEEFAVLGMEGVDNPVFVMQIADEEKRSQIFSKVISSIIVKSDTSLIVDGMRLPQLMLPPFLQAILGVMGINLPTAYYYVHDGYIYFSLSPEPLSALYSSASAGKTISLNDEWKEVAPKVTKGTSLSLYYNLARSVPFFLRDENTLTQILSLYTIGRCDLSLGNSNLGLSLNALSLRSGDLRSIPGFPFQIEGEPSPYVIAQKTKDGEFAFWVEDKTKIRSMNTGTRECTELSLPDPCTIEENKSPASEAFCIWAGTSRGEVYLLNDSLEIKPGFPVSLSAPPAAECTSFEGGLAVPLSDGSVALVSPDGSKKYVELPLLGSLKAPPYALGNTLALYDKSVMGSIFIIKDGKCINENDPMEVSGIAFGSPALMESRGVLRTAFITQAGNLYLWKDGRLEAGFPKQLEGIFFQNVTASANYFYALSSDARLYRISPNGETLVVQIPNASAEDAHVLVAEPNKNGVKSIYVSPDSNTIWGFNEKLELLAAYPLSGWGTPAFMDTNGDGSAECFTVSMDRTINAWNLR